MFCAYCSSAISAQEVLAPSWQRRVRVIPVFLGKTPISFSPKIRARTTPSRLAATSRPGSGQERPWWSSPHSAKGGAEETGCSDLHDVMHQLTIYCYPNPLHEEIITNLPMRSMSASQTEEVRKYFYVRN